LYPLSLLLLLSALYAAQANNSSLPPLPPPGAAPALAPDAAAAPPAPSPPAEAGGQKKAPEATYYGTDKPLSPGPPPSGAFGEPVRPPEKPKGPAAEVYYYKDENGNLKAVDSLDAVPEKFRAKAKAVKKRE
jgi:hypothetical protein